MRLAGTVALVVGGSGGIGAATCRALAREGAAVGVHYGKSKDAAVAVVRDIETAGGRAIALAADVTRKQQAERLVVETIRALGGLDALVVYAGHPFRPEEWFAPYESLPEEAFRSTLDVDLLGAVFVTQAVVPHFKHKRSGRIVLIGSTPPITGDTAGFTYLVAKAGVLALTKGLAQYLGPHNVHVNAIAPGTVATVPMESLPPEERARLVDEAALKRLGTAEEIAAKAVFLCSPESDYMTGQTLVVDGGYAMRGLGRRGRRDLQDEVRLRAAPVALHRQDASGPARVRLDDPVAAAADAPDRQVLLGPREPEAERAVHDRPCADAEIGGLGKRDFRGHAIRHPPRPPNTFRTGPRARGVGGGTHKDSDWVRGRSQRIHQHRRPEGCSSMREGPWVRGDLNASRQHPKLVGYQATPRTRGRE